MRGFFITIEGIEGAGKTTALNFIKNFFADINLSAVFTREPGGTANAEQIRQLLLSKELESPLPETELMLMFASRLEHTKNLILPALEADNVVVSDRYYDASYAYQGGGRLLDTRKIDELRSWVLGDFTPNLTILLDVPIS
ncbi:MAG: dTMP kinase, partial [Pseudomonadota bacterium]|nr:dTMP kinase [Pseudomonadota bacterium]